MMEILVNPKIRYFLQRLRVKTPTLTLRRPCSHAWRTGLFYGAPRSYLQVISKRRKMTSVKIQFSFFENKSCCLGTKAWTQ